jgi:2-pyrone-4,6-dicarboxylate lactonase
MTQDTSSNCVMPRQLPKGTIDTHFHLFGPECFFPYDTERSYTPNDVNSVSYSLLAKTLGISRAVIVQPSVYGTDNRRLLNGLVEFDFDIRGVVVIDETISDDELMKMHEMGVRAIRINLVFRAGVGFKTAILLAPRLKDLGWHIQFFVDVSSWPEMIEIVEKICVPVIFDHVGYVQAKCTTGNKGFNDLLSLMKEELAWVKLSGIYRMTNAFVQAPYLDVRPFVDAVISANPEQIVWASDWPHTSIKVPMPDDKELIEMVLEWIGLDSSLRKLIFVENPERLYGFQSL